MVHFKHVDGTRAAITYVSDNDGLAQLKINAVPRAADANVGARLACCRRAGYVPPFATVAGVDDVFLL